MFYTPEISKLFHFSYTESNFNLSERSPDCDSLKGFTRSTCDISENALNLVLMKFLTFCYSKNSDENL